jgi:hypothetical protein
MAEVDIDVFTNFYRAIYFKGVAPTVYTEPS